MGEVANISEEVGNGEFIRWPYGINKKALSKSINFSSSYINLKMKK